LRGAEGGSSLYVSDGLLQGILPPIPNLQFGYLYNFGKSVRGGRFSADYLFPLGLSKDSAVFGEAHAEFQNFWQKSDSSNRADVSIGGGYRAILGDSALLGVNGFYDTTRLGSRWYSSGGVGVEMAALVSGGDALDLNFNWYGRLFDGEVIRNAFRRGLANFDVEAGFSHELWEGGPDLRLKITGYQFDAGTRSGGWNVGGEIKTRDGVCTLKYEVGNDRINRTYHTVGGFLNVGFRLGALLKGENPFEPPEPVFKSPRNLHKNLTGAVNRSWRQPASVVVHKQMQMETPGQGTGEPCNLIGRFRVEAATIVSGQQYLVQPAYDRFRTPYQRIVLYWCGLSNPGQKLEEVLLRSLVCPPFQSCVPYAQSWDFHGLDLDGREGGPEVQDVGPSYLFRVGHPYVVFEFSGDPLIFESGGGISFDLLD
jgi:hypothetical protein